MEKEGARTEQGSDHGLMRSTVPDKSCQKERKKKRKHRERGGERGKREGKNNFLPSLPN